MFSIIIKFETFNDFKTKLLCTILNLLNFIRKKIRKNTDMNSMEMSIMKNMASPKATNKESKGIFIW